MQTLIANAESLARIAIATLLNSLWEAAILTFVVWLILRALPNLSATTRYAAWCAALTASFVLPIATAIPQISVQRSAATSAVVEHRAVPPVTAEKIGGRRTPPTQKAVEPSTAPALRLPDRLRFALPQYVAFLVFALWALAAALMFVRFGLSLVRLERLKRDALPLPVDYRERLVQWANAEKGGRDVRLCVCDELDVPVAVGLFDSMILMPRHLLDTLSAQEIDQIMLHELGHLRRADDWTNGMQRVLQALFFFNPAIMYIAQQLDLEREVACDDWVVAQTKDVRPYATCLTKMAEVTAWPHRPLAAPGVFVTRRGLSLRVERLLRAGRNVRTKISLGSAGALVAALVVVIFLVQSVAPSFAFTLASDGHIVSRPLQAPQTHNIAATRLESAHTVALARAAASPAPMATQASTATYVPAPRHRIVTIPAQHIHVPARTIAPVNIDIPERKLQLSIPDEAQVRAKIEASMRTSQASMRAGLEQMKTSMNASLRSKGVYNCMGCDFSGQTLVGRNFRGQRMSGSDFSRANLENADFSSTELVGVDFNHANLRGASFADARMTGCDLSHANVAQAVFTGVQMTGCDLSGIAAGPQQSAGMVRGCQAGCDFSRFDLHGADLRGLHATGLDFERSNFAQADLSGSTFTGVDFERSRFDGARLVGVTFDNCGLDGVDVAHLIAAGAHVINGTDQPAAH